MENYFNLSDALEAIRDANAMQSAQYISIPIPPIALTSLEMCNQPDDLLTAALEVRDQFKPLRDEMNILREILADRKLTPLQKTSHVEKWQNSWLILCAYDKQARKIKLAKNSYAILDSNLNFDIQQPNRIPFIEIMNTILERCKEEGSDYWNVRVLHQMANRYLHTPDEAITSNIEKIFNHQLTPKDFTELDQFLKAFRSDTKNNNDGIPVKNTPNIKRATIGAAVPKENSHTSNETKNSPTPHIPAGLFDLTLKNKKLFWIGIQYFNEVKSLLNMTDDAFSEILGVSSYHVRKNILVGKVSKTGKYFKLIEEKHPEYGIDFLVKLVERLTPVAEEMMNRELANEINKKERSDNKRGKGRKAVEKWNFLLSVFLRYLSTSRHRFKSLMQKRTQSATETRMLNCIYRAFIEHPESVGESYWQHLRFACGVSFQLTYVGFACLVHGIVPAFFITTASRFIAKTH